MNHRCEVWEINESYFSVHSYRPVSVGAFNCDICYLCKCRQC